MDLSLSRIRPMAFFLAVFAFLSSGPAFAAKPEIFTEFLSSNAVGGYDTVAFFTEGKPVEGKKEFSLEWKGATWRFASAENKALFEAAPEKYAPQYGGYCAWAASQGYTAPGRPKFWTIVDGKLYLNFDKGVQDDWLKDVPGFIAKADANWPGILSK